ncbi:helix-turn-helix transcriptional regulator [Flavobacterium lindanitolerans]|uniref:helix-turn-helix transcriptional regulator n=1 Tax=Flavobacterium lindanitolerans TaxID=428988 RepID=UPI0027B9A66D|nr:helix-turn-helix transcriptional regulator [Flavobacterium lindanitolerans]
MEKPSELVRLGNRIKELRLAKGLSQAKLGMKILKDQQSIHKLENAEFNPTYLYLLEICEGLEITISELLDFK